MTDRKLDTFMDRVMAFLDRYEAQLPAPQPQIDWAETTAARWVPAPDRSVQDGWLRPLTVNLDLELNDLQGIDRQKALLAANTRQFVAGLPANNALLWGARGTGKSSLVRALLARHQGEGLRLIEIDKADLVQLPTLIEHIAGEPWRFLLFCDDLAFEADDSAYKTLKTVLDGTVEAAPENLLLYATSNRRHLLPEQRSDNLGASMVDGELHPGEAIEEKIALSDRFGLWISFYPFSQEHYLQVVRHWLQVLGERYGRDCAWDDELGREAIRWALARGNRNGRCAYQFARQHLGRLLLEPCEPVGPAANVQSS